MTEQKQNEGGHKNYKGFVAGVFSGVAKLTGTFTFLFLALRCVWS